MSQIKDAQNVKLFALNSNLPLAQKVADNLGLQLGDCTVSHFADGEISIEINESVRGCEVYVLQSVSEPVNTNLMELLIMVDALRRASAAKINVVMPYYGYARQDRKARSREPITAKLVANLLQDDRINRLITIDLHAPQVQGFFDIPVDHLRSARVLINYFLGKGLTVDDLVIVAPDHAGVSLVRQFAEKIGGVPIAIVDKRDQANREQADETVPETLIGDVDNKTAVIVDDIVDTGSRMANSARLLKKCGAKHIYAAATHAVLSHGAVGRIEESPIEKLVVTDTIVLPKEKQSAKIVQLSVAGLLGDAIARIHSHQSLQPLFK
ncbi:ribose-phosphate diphosphokinase [Limosilactobacillus secaliphilus]|uniref:Ribose-phosphate pyrophosphokinase n=1 Tax=Limosilactobacillus secaliphilus TaxID=396268 RepID=A0A0R2I0S2_9LACO|nr:ribose-phosphate pyrophosphokinase [Limosilactobacillus secaliphilus]KRN58705.1 ribose-phosphate pyrophosphokinase [Limosilactobacillus secaliphilus]